MGAGLTVITNQSTGFTRSIQQPSCLSSINGMHGSRDFVLVNFGGKIVHRVGQGALCLRRLFDCKLLCAVLTDSVLTMLLCAVLFHSRVSSQENNRKSN